MISSETFNNVKYFSKIALILIIVFLLLKFIINLSPYEAILLACIIAPGGLLSALFKPITFWNEIACNIFLF